MKQKYDPITALMSLQHEANHYKNIMHPRKGTINFQRSSQRKSKMSRTSNKFEKERQNAIQKQNQRLYKDFLDINRKKGLLQKVQEESRRYQQTRKTKRPTLVNAYKAKEDQQKIRRQNQLFCEKLKKLKPIIGEKKKWSQHQKFNNKMTEKLRSRTISMVDQMSTEQLFLAMIGQKKQSSSPFSTFYKTIHTSTPKTSQKLKSQSLRKNDVEEIAQSKNMKKKSRRKKSKKPQTSQFKGRIIGAGKQYVYLQSAQRIQQAQKTQ